MGQEVDHRCVPTAASCRKAGWSEPRGRDSGLTTYSFKIKLILFVQRLMGRKSVFLFDMQMTICLEASIWGKITENKMIVLQPYSYKTACIYCYLYRKSKFSPWKKQKLSSALPVFWHLYDSLSKRIIPHKVIPILLADFGKIMR